jgi:hypothetical protein
MGDDIAMWGEWTSGECAGPEEAPAPTSRHERHGDAAASRPADEQTTPDAPRIEANGSVLGWRCERCRGSGDCGGCNGTGLETGAPAVVELVLRGGTGVFEIGVRLANYLSRAAHVDASAERHGESVVLRLLVRSAPSVADVEQPPRTLPRLPELDGRRAELHREAERNRT